MKTNLLLGGLVIVLVLGMVALSQPILVPAKALPAHTTLRVQCAPRDGRLKLFTNYVCTVTLAHGDGGIPRLVLDFRGVNRWAEMGASGKLGWNEGDADYAAQRVAGSKTAIDFGVSADKVTFTVMPKRLGHFVTSIRAYVGGWRLGRPRIVSALTGAVVRWSVWVGQ